MRLIGVVILSLVVAVPTIVQAQTPNVTSSAAKKKKPAVSPLKASYEAMPLNERIAIQIDLIWVGDYNGIADGEFGDRAIAAVKAFQKRSGTKETGVLNPQERAALATASKSKQDGAGWRIVADRVTGARLGVPMKIVPQASTATDTSRWSSLRGEAQIEVAKFTGPGVTLASVYDQQRKTPAGRRIEYNVLKQPNFFVITGLQGLKKFYVRAGGRDGDVRVMTILYDQAMEGIMDPIVVAMSSSFNAFPGGSVAAAAPKPKVEYGTGVVVTADGHVLTDRQMIDGCQVVTLAGIGSADVLVQDKDTDLALLRVYGARGLAPIMLASETKSGDVMLVGIADPTAQAGDAKVTSVAAKVGNANGPTRTLETTPILGFSGAPLIDQGKLVGLATIRRQAVAGPPAPPQAAAVNLEAIRAFLTSSKVTPASSTSGEVKMSVVRVICVRK